jgi:hypothetical protein
MRFHLIKMPRAEYRLAIAYHHIVLDGWSVSLLVGELLALCRRPGSLPQPPQLRDWLRALVARDTDAARRAWREALGGMRRPTVLASAGAIQSAPPSARFAVSLPAPATELLIACASRNRLTMNTIVQAAWGILLAEQTAAQDVVFGTVVSDREPGIPGVEHIVGLLINTVPVVVRVRRDLSVLALLDGLRQDQQRIAPHQHLGLGTIQRLAGWTAEFDTLLSFENPAFQLTNLMRGTEAPRLVAADFSDDTYYTISLVVTPGRCLRLSFTYRPDLLDARQVRSMASRLMVLLTAMPGGLHQPVADLIAVKGPRTS